MFRKIVILLCVLTTWARCLAEQDSIRVSLLTCSPGQEVYSLYGHTAIRVQIPKDSIDEVFNYGVFDMSKPHFAWHFVLGETDYMVVPIPWEYFTIDYEKRGSSITEQELNLTPDEASRLVSNLIENSQPQNRVYRQRCAIWWSKSSWDEYNIPTPCLICRLVKFCIITRLSIPGHRKATTFCLVPK